MSASPSLDSRSLKEPHSHSPMQCPQCTKSASLIQVQEAVPLFGKVLVQTLSCPHCGFKWSDVMSLEFREPLAFEVKIKNEKGLNIKLVRNSSGTVEIPELGVKLEPGPFAEGFFTNMEGLLDRVENVLSLFLRGDDRSQKKAAVERLKDLHACREGKKSFTVIVKDPFGGSALIGKGVKKIPLSAKEAELLKTGMFVESK